MTALRRLAGSTAAAFALAGSAVLAWGGSAAGAGADGGVGIPLAPSSAVEVVQTTADLAQRLTRLPDLQFGTAALSDEAVIHVNDQLRYTNATLYPGLELPEPSEAKLLVADLEPALRAARLHPKIYGDDWGWGPTAAAYARALAGDPAAKTITGLAWHCYFGSPYTISAVRRIDPNLEQIVDECSPGITPFPTSEVVISAVRNWASTVALWNLALDPQGGPVQAPNSGCFRCAGLVTVDQHGNVQPNLHYFQLGQASAFVLRGAYRVDSEHFVSYFYRHRGVNIVTPGLDDVAFVNPDGSRVLLAYNNSAEPISFGLAWRGKTLSYTLPAQAMVTLIWNRHG